MLFIVDYEVIGDRCTGAYIVNTNSKANAKKIVRELDEDYVCRGSAVKLGKYNKLIAMTDEQFNDFCANHEEEVFLELSDVKEVPNEGDVYNLFSGT